MNQTVSFFYRIGFWHRGDEATIKQLSLKLFYCLYLLSFIVAGFIGAINCEDEDEMIFLVEVSIVILVLFVKLCFLISSQKEILYLLNSCCIFSVRHHDDYNFVNEKLRKLMKFATLAVCIVIIGGVCDAEVVPFIGNERTLFFKIAFPLDWRNNEFAFWIANIFILSEVILAITTFLFSITIWYLMLNCALRYEVLGNELRNMGMITEPKIQMSYKENQNIFLRNLKALIETHLQITKLLI